MADGGFSDSIRSVFMSTCVSCDDWLCWLVGWYWKGFHFLSLSLTLWTSCWQVASPEFQAWSLPFSPVTGHSSPGPTPGRDRRLTLGSSYRTSTIKYSMYLRIPKRFSKKSWAFLGMDPLRELIRPNLCVCVYVCVCVRPATSWAPNTDVVYQQ